MDIQSYLTTQQVTQDEFAERLGVSQGMVGHWIHGRCRIVAERARQIEEVTGGLVTRHELRPDIFDPPRTAAA